MFILQPVVAQSQGAVNTHLSSAHMAWADFINTHGDQSYWSGLKYLNNLNKYWITVKFLVPRR